MLNFWNLPRRLRPTLFLKIQKITLLVYFLAFEGHLSQKKTLNVRIFAKQRQEHLNISLCIYKTKVSSPLLTDYIFCFHRKETTYLQIVLRPNLNKQTCPWQMLMLLSRPFWNQATDYEQGNMFDANMESDAINEALIQKDTYSSVPNRSAGPKKRAGGKILEKE